MTFLLLAAIVTNLGIMPPTNLTHRAFPAHAAPTNQVNVTLAWLNNVSNYPSWGWDGGSTITNTNGLVIWSTNGGHWVAHYLDLRAASNDMRTGLYGSTNLKTWYLRTNMPFSVNGKAVLKMLPDYEFLQATNQPKAK